MSGVTGGTPRPDSVRSSTERRRRDERGAPPVHSPIWHGAVEANYPGGVVGDGGGDFTVRWGSDGRRIERLLPMWTKRRPLLVERPPLPLATGRHRMWYGYDYSGSGLRPVWRGPIQFGRKLPGTCRDAGKGAANSGRHRARDGLHPRNARNAVLWSGRWESNPRSQLGRLGLYH